MKISKLSPPMRDPVAAGQLKVKSFFKNLIAFLRKNKLEALILTFILGFSSFFRLYKLDKLLGFWYDQGRDALVIWNLLHDGKFFLIGPVTGIEGIFLGPFYYYLLVPFYFFGGGNPVVAAIGLSLLTVAAIYLIFCLARDIYGEEVGLLAAFLYGFSYHLVTFSRWLANPNPLPFFTIATLLALYKFSQGKGEKFLVAAFFLVGLCLQLEAASAIFFIPSIAIFLFYQRKQIKDAKALVFSLLAFLITLLPQIIFDIRHHGILTFAFRKFLLSDKSFKISFFRIITDRFRLYFDVFFGRLFPNGTLWQFPPLALFSATVILFRKKIFNQGGKLLAIWVFVPLLGFFFYQGNYGYIWDYYFTGYFPAFLIIFSAGLFYLAQKGLLAKVIVFVFLTLFLTINIGFLFRYFKGGFGITLQAEKWAIDWIYQDADKENFNVDVYVPPKIYYSYSYLFRWYGTQRYGREPETRLVKNLYTLAEPDSEHPQFLKAWLARQDGIGKIIKSESWGGINVQKRERIKYE